MTSAATIGSTESRTVWFSLTNARSALRGGVGIAAIAAIAIGVRMLYLDRTPFIDELNHVLAARSLLSDGTLSLGGEGPYLRAWEFTYLVAGLFSVFGESLAVGRMPAVLAGTGLVVALFVWVRNTAGSLAAWISALLLCFYPYSLLLSQQVRFYTVHALAFWLAVFCVYRLMERRSTPRQGIALGTAAAGCLLIALGLSELTLIGIAGTSLWVVAVGLRPTAARIRASRRDALLAAAIGVVVLGVGLRWVASGEARYVWFLFNYADAWAASRSGDLRYYHEILLNQYGSAWSVFPVVALVALAKAPRAALLCLCIFAVALVLHSLAAWKDERYFYHAMPAFFAIVGMASASALLWVRERAAALARMWLGRSPPPWLLSGSLLLLVAVTLRFGWGTNRAFAHGFAIVTAGPTEIPTPYYKSNWDRAVPRFEEDIEDGAIVVTSADLKALYYLDRLDYDLFADHLSDQSGVRPEFGIVSKTGRPAISRAESMRQVVACHPHGVVIVEEYHWRRAYGVPAETADYLAANLEQVTLLPNAHMLAFRWRRPDHDTSGDCPPRAR